MRNDANQKEHQITEQDWNDAIASDTDNVDLKYAKGVFLDKSESQMQEAFSRSVIERADELRFMPDHLFNYYFPFLQ